MSLKFEGELNRERVRRWVLVPRTWDQRFSVGLATVRRMMSY
jgi:hypothetical protein